MIQFERWKIITVLIICLLAVLYSSPNVVGSKAQGWMQQSLPGWMPHKTINLGLDLQGGAHLLLEVGVDVVVKERISATAIDARQALRKEKIRYLKGVRETAKGIRLELVNPGQADQVKSILRGVDRDFDILVQKNGKFVEANLSDVAYKTMIDQTLEQSIEIVRRRVDEMGTLEPVIQRHGDDRIILQVPGLEDPEILKNLLGKTAKLSFHLVDTGLKGSARAGGGMMKLPMLENPGERIPVARRPLVTGDMLTNAQYCSTQFGQSAVCFNLNNLGAKRFCDVTRKHTNEPFAIVLDGEVISAPNINEPICGGAGQISGSFSIQEANDLALLLRAGALPAPLKVLEERTVGPSLGADSVSSGKIASMVGFLLIIVFMAMTYGLYGVFADIALMVNVALIFSVLSILQATLTLPGIAGIVLTIGMAVDANVLIFERIKEEVRKGRTALSAIDAGYRRAKDTIIDSNLTTLIAAFILFSFGTGPIKGFAVTLMVGIVTSFFSAIMITRLMVVLWQLKKKPEVLPV